ncbi:ORF127 [Agrotis segetum granulovirus]|uniref:ORF127 n=1 Tax=Agrotis segetum granulosis virus TaxID=10464 RepID=Q6QXI7_GVAS|nr:vp1054 [Agrotis segetum granulovirus]AAS82611.1 ORF127 [Agrotis segetum granulovirus]AKN63417.1 vp1054 [Agrotis segetum granulovirus]
MLSSQHATVRSIPFQPIVISKSRCRFHPNSATCRLIRIMGREKVFYEHYSEIDTRFASVTGMPYFQWLLSGEENVDRRHLLVNTSLICGAKFFEVHGEKLGSIKEAGERNMSSVKLVLKSVYKFLNNDRTDLNGNARDASARDGNKTYVLLKSMYVDCLYSDIQCIILPQEMYCIYKEGEEPHLNKIFTFSSLPEFTEATASQDIYKSFLTYNTVLTMLLQEKNPFNDKKKVISKIIENVGTCNRGIEGGKKSYIKICELKFGNSINVGHIMCPPKDMVKRIYHYAKWTHNPNNYKRYIDLILRDSKQNDTVVRDWQMFQSEFRNYFFPDE